MPKNSSILFLALSTAMSIRAATVTVSVDSAQDRRAVSPYIYGVNGIPSSNGVQRIAHQPLSRSGGNRLTGYNWENNASNAGTDWGPNASDDLMCWNTCPDHEAPGAAIKAYLDGTLGWNAAALVTIPIVDYVAADKNGVVTQPANVDGSRWKINRAKKGSAPSLNPDKSDGFVNQDEFVNWVETSYASARASGKEIFYSLDNEPGLWPHTHPMIHPGAVTYAEMSLRTRTFGGMIKDRNPNAVVFGGVCYGYGEFLNLQGAPDAAGRDYLDFLLQEWRGADQAQGRRVVDVLDLHWYPEAYGGGQRIIVPDDLGAPNQGLLDARLQAPRSLWDPTYVEDSWVASGTPINLLNRLKQKISTHYPGTKLAFTEYNYGGSEHVSGGLAQADVLGVFGREGVFAATLWRLWGDEQSFIFGGYDMYLNYDGAGARVGGSSVRAQVSDRVKVSAYALADDADPGKLWVVLINKTTETVTAAVTVSHGQTLTSGNAYRLTSANRRPQGAGSVSLSGNALSYDMPPLSATTLALRTSGGSGSAPGQPGNFTAQAAGNSAMLDWDAAAGATGYVVERAVGSGAFAQIAAPGAGVTSHADPNLSAGVAYSYRVKSVNGFGESTHAGPVTVTVSGPGTGNPGPAAGSRPGEGETRVLSVGKDGRNDGVTFQGSEARVMDLHGKVVAELKGASPAWDGRIDGRPAPSGVYVVRVKGSDGSVRYEKVLLVK
jgi:hypothetical protein